MFKVGQLVFSAVPRLPSVAHVWHSRGKNPAVSLIEAKFELTFFSHLFLQENSFLVGKSNYI